MNIFEFNDYKKYVSRWVKSQPKAGYGQMKSIAEALGTSSVVVSQIFKSDRQLSEEQALELAEYLGLMQTESDYLMLLVRYQRASTHKLKTRIKQQITEAAEQSLQLKSRVKTELVLSENDKAIFYSTWEHSALRLAFDIPSIKSVAQAAERLSIELSRAKKIVEFLIDKGLLMQSEKGIEMGPQIVFLEKDSPLIVSRQRAWRVKAFQEMETDSQDNFFYTCPYVASKKTLKSLKAKVLKLVEESLEDVKPSASEELFCMNIDWFKP